jgi:hypothetical protein
MKRATITIPDAIQQALAAYCHDQGANPNLKDAGRRVVVDIRLVAGIADAPSFQDRKPAVEPIRPREKEMI